MKKIYILLALIFLASSFLSAQADKVAGVWLTEEETSQVQIYKGNDGKFYGKITWLDEPNENGKPKVDDDNPDPALQNRPIMGLVIVKALEYDSRKEEWKGGTIYDPKSGKTYDAVMWFEDDPQILFMRGFVSGMRFLGRSSEWKKENDRNR